MLKHPVSLALSEQVLKQIDQQARIAKRSRSSWVQLHFEELFRSSEPQLKEEIAFKMG
jgi:hypothetical protein